MTEPDSEYVKTFVSTRLKHVDSLVKQGKIDDALNEISHVRKLDPNNPYALAYEERIQTLKNTLEVRTEQKPAVPPPKDSPLSGTPLQTTILSQPVSELGKDPSSQPPETEGQISQIVPVPAPASESMESKFVTPEVREPRSTGKGAIVLIDDDSMLIQAYAELFEDNRYTTRTFTRSEDGYEYLRNHTPDIVLCDVNLENSSYGGFTLFEKIRKLEHLRTVPFIFISGMNDTAIVLAGKELGADDYLTKPIDPDVLLSVVKGKLKRYRQMRKNV